MDQIFEPTTFGALRRRKTAPIAKVKS